MLAIEAASVVDGEVVGDDLILTRQDGSQINAGDVRGAQGIQGVPGSDLVVVTARDLFDVGVPNQVKAGRQLSAADFTNMGLAAPAGLWNLSNANDSSGNGRNLTNKGTVTFAKGIGGLATTAAQFTGSTAQALYILDTGAADPFRLKTGTIGCWFRCSQVGAAQALMGKYSATDGQHNMWLNVTAGGLVEYAMTPTGLNAGNVAVYSTSIVSDDRWHFIVGTLDGAQLAIYVDGILERTQVVVGPAYTAGASAPFNIGGLQATAAQATLQPTKGRIDEAFVTSDVLSEDQIRNLYCSKIAHALGSTPKRVALNVRRRKKGAALATTDFPATPLRLYNFTAGALTDQGSNNTPLTVSGTGALAVSGADGAAGNAYDLNGSSTFLQATDTGLPSGTASRSYGLWLKYLATTGTRGVMGWGASASSTAAQMLYVLNDGVNDGILIARNIDNNVGGVYAGDGKWHFVVVTEENAPVDGMKRKLYFDGKCVAAGVTLTTFALGGANRFKIGVYPDGVGSTFRGQVDSAFVYNGVLDAAEIAVLYAKGAQALGISPKNPGDHIEMMTATDLYCDFSTLDTQEQVDLAVA
jgi:hypothetical protein